MNKKCFRVIFSKTLQRLIVTSELAKTTGKSNETSGSFGLPDLQLFARIRPLTFSLFCALGFVAFSNNALAETLIIQADKSAPKNQQPIVLQTANGLPQVNIQTPNEKGLSHNKYSKFDVDTKGAILNNSRTNVQTQQAGWVQGNPYLARGEAKVILNEVNSNNPSVLKGYVEVAGKKADVIIANPSGLHCDGCGVINANRATLTTGKPQIQQGSLDSFVVEKGKVTVEGKGLDNSKADYTEILSREVQANAGVWTNKALKVVTGKNHIKRSDSTDNLQIIHTNSPLASENSPQFAVDVGELGGMYAGKIHLIGTEAGVGVRNAGHIGASSDTLHIDSQGRIINTGTLNAQKQVHLTGTTGIENKGKIENRQENIQLTTQADIKQDGSVVARGGDIHKKATKAITQQGETVAKGNITYTAPTIQATTNSLLAAGVTITENDKGETRQLDTQSAQGKSIQLTATDNTTLQGKNLASGNLIVNAERINLNHSQNSANSIIAQAKTGNIEANSASLVAQEKLKLSTPKTLSTQSSYISAKTIDTTQQSLNAKNAIWTQTGEGDFRLKADTINTEGGRITTQGNFFVEGRHLENSEGTLSSGKSLNLNVTEAIHSSSGRLIAEEHLHLTTASTNNDAGLIYAKQGMVLESKASISNKNTNEPTKGIVAGGDLKLHSFLVDNQNGRISSTGDLNLTTTTLNSHLGSITADKLDLTATKALNNEAGLIQSRGDIVLHTETLINRNTLPQHQDEIKGVLSLGKLVVNATQLINRQGYIASQGSQTLNVSSLDNQQGIISSQKTQSITVQDNIQNQAGRISAKGISITAGQLENNAQGYIQSLGSLTIETNQLDNQGGVVQAISNMTLTAPTVLNNQVSETGSRIESGSQLTMTTHKLENRNTIAKENTPSQGIIAQQFFLHNTQKFDNQLGGVYIGKNGQLNIAQTLNNQQGEMLSWGDITLLGGKSLNVDNQAGKLQANNYLTVKANNLSGDGHLEGNHIDLSLQSDFSTARDINAGSTLTIATDGNLTNSKKLSANDRLTLTAKEITNTESGRISAATTQLTANHTLINEGLINSFSENTLAKTVLKATRIENRGMGRIYGDDVALGADTILNQDKNGSSATLAARHRLDLAGREIINDTQHYDPSVKTGSTIYSEGDIVFGRELNSEDRAEGKASELRNKSSLIEAGGDIVLNVAQTFNTNEHFTTEMKEYPEEGNKEHSEYVLINLANDNLNTGFKAKTDRFYRQRLPGKNGHRGYDLLWVHNLDRKLSDDELEGYIPEANKQICANGDKSLCYYSPHTIYGSDYGIWKRFNIEPSSDMPTLNLPALMKEPTAPRKPSNRRLRNPTVKQNYEADLEKYRQDFEQYKQSVVAYTQALQPYLDWVKKNDEAFVALNTAIQQNNQHYTGNNRKRWMLSVNETKVIKETEKTSLPAQMLANNNIIINGVKLMNDKSTIITGNDILSKDNNVDIKNVDKKGEKTVSLLGSYEYVNPRWRGKLRGWRHYNHSGPSTRVEKSTFDMNLYTYLTHQAIDVVTPKPPKETNLVDLTALASYQNNQLKPVDTVAIGAIISTNDMLLSGKEDSTLKNLERLVQDEIEIRSVKVDTRLPNQGLYRINPNAESHFIIETDPDFTDRKRWLSSDYMFNALRYEPNTIQKRLGDGFYEQRLVREQINRLTGRQFLGNYQDFDSQYKALMDAGVTFAQKFNLRPGIALSPTQVAQLTSDIVWFESQPITLPNGSVTQALVPKIYALARKGDIEGKGTLISANRIGLNATTLTNEGTIAGRKLVQLNAQQLKNQGKFSAGVLNATITGDAENIGGVIEADNALLLKVAGNFTHRSTTQTTNVDLEGYKRSDTTLDRKALLHTKNPNGTLQLEANNITIAGADIINDGKGQSYIAAKNNLNLTALAVGFDEKIGGGNHYRNEKVQDVAVSHIKGAGDVVLKGHHIDSEGAEVEAGQHAIALAENQLLLGTAERQSEYEEYHKNKKRHLTGSSQHETFAQAEKQQEKVSRFTGKDILLQSNGTTTLIGTTAVAEGNVTVVGKQGVLLDVAHNQLSQHSWEKQKKKGFLVEKSAGTLRA
ncbi:two-partner secretion domain-containing protein, partial [Ursidibacter sp. B-7004-1]